MKFFDSLPTPLKHCLYSNNVLQFTYDEFHGHVKIQMDIFSLSRVFLFIWV